MHSQSRAPELIGESPVFQDALAHASAIAEIDRPVLILGERGSGKELLAARIHFLSTRWEGPLVKVNCAAMNEDLLESELFGHEAGAFTGAQKKHRGRFERAEDGTLFLDEIASASLRVQEKLLRVIEYGEFERVGGETTLSADVRIVAAANVDLRTRVAKGDFRADLLDRLAFDVVHAPPLRNRIGDIPLLAAHFGASMAAEMDIPFPGFGVEAMSALRAHSWPGNVRELKNVVERAVFHWARSGGDGQINAVTLDPFPDLETAAAPALTQPPLTQKNCEIRQRPAAPTPAAFDLRAHLDALEKKLVVEMLAARHGHQGATAKALSLTYDQLRGIIRKHDLNPKEIAKNQEV